MRDLSFGRARAFVVIVVLVAIALVLEAGRRWAP
jgi:hypothetical protein